MSRRYIYRMAIAPTTTSPMPEPDDELWVTLPQELVEAVALVHLEGETLESFVNDMVREGIARRRFVGPPKPSQTDASEAQKLETTARKPAPLVGG